jgi:hypothetical protein
MIDLHVSRPLRGDTSDGVMNSNYQLYLVKLFSFSLLFSLFKIKILTNNPKRFLKQKKKNKMHPQKNINKRIYNGN